MPPADDPRRDDDPDRRAGRDDRDDRDGQADRPRDPADEDLAALLSDLRSTLTALRDELGPDADTSDGRPETPPGFPPLPPRPSEVLSRGDRERRSRRRPPSVRDVLRFTEEYTIPTLVAVLEANIRLLELVGGALRALDPEKSATARAGRNAGRVGRGASDAGRAAVDRLSSGLSDLQSALEGTDLPENPEARSLVQDARSLSAEVQARLAERGDGDQRDLSEFEGREERGRADRTPEDEDGPVTIPIDDGSHSDRSDGDTDRINGGDDGGADESAGADVDVESELETIKDEMGVGDEDEDARRDADDDEDTDAGQNADGDQGDGEDDPDDASERDRS